MTLRDSSTKFTFDFPGRPFLGRFFHHHHGLPLIGRLIGWGRPFAVGAYSMRFRGLSTAATSGFSNSFFDDIDSGL